MLMMVVTMTMMKIEEVVMISLTLRPARRG